MNTIRVSSPVRGGRKYFPRLGPVNTRLHAASKIDRSFRTDQRDGRRAGDGDDGAGVLSRCDRETRSDSANQWCLIGSARRGDAPITLGRRITTWHDDTRDFRAAPSRFGALRSSTLGTIPPRGARFARASSLAASGSRSTKLAAMPSAGGGTIADGHSLSRTMAGREIAGGNSAARLSIVKRGEITGRFRRRPWIIRGEVRANLSSDLVERECTECVNVLVGAPCRT